MHDAIINVHKEVSEVVISTLKHNIVTTPKWPELCFGSVSANTTTTTPSNETNTIQLNSSQKFVHSSEQTTLIFSFTYCAIVKVRDVIPTNQ